MCVYVCVCVVCVVCVHRFLCLGLGIAHPIMCHCAKSMAASASAWQCKGPKQLRGRRIAHRYAVTASVILDNQTLSALGAYRGSEGSWWTPSLPTCPRLQQRTQHMHDTHAMTGVAGMMRDGSKGNIGAIFTGALEALVLVPTRNCVHVHVSHQLRQYFCKPNLPPLRTP